MDPNVDSDSRQEARDFATETTSSSFSPFPAVESKPMGYEELRAQVRSVCGRYSPEGANPLPERRRHAENAQHSPSPGWSPYEVWYTQVRAVQIARSCSMPTALPARVPAREGYPRTSGFSQAARNVALMLRAWWVP
jgi:hypothetical protein